MDLLTPVDLLANLNKQPDIQLAIKGLQVLQRHSGRFSLSPELLEDNAAALRTNDWSHVSARLRSLACSQSRLFLIAPYSVRRLGRRINQLSGFFADPVGGAPNLDYTGAIQECFGEVRQEVPLMVALHAIAVCGLFGGSEGEAFIVPSGLPPTTTPPFPAFNLLCHQRQRFAEFGRANISAIFSDSTARFLFDKLGASQVEDASRNAEYQSHDAGHASGIGLNTKLRSGAISGSWHRAVEEWRADGVGFLLYAHCHTHSCPSEASVIASNLCTRFGIDAQRRGGLELDTDVNASILTLQSLLESGCFTINGDGKIQLLRESDSELVASTQLLKARAAAMTRREFALTSAEGISQLYGLVGIDPAIVAVFQQVILRNSVGKSVLP